MAGKNVRGLQAARDALSLMESRILEEPTLDAARVRHRMGVIDTAQLRVIIDSIAAAQRPDGSWYGSLLRSAEMLLLLRELNAPAGPVTNAACGWIVARTNAAGRFGERCTPDLHSAGLCGHFTAGFFGPAPASVPLDALRLESGCRIGSDQDARIAASSLACAALIECGWLSADIRLHIDGNERIVRAAATAAVTISTVALCAAIRTLLAMRGHRDVNRTITIGLHHLTRLQRADGSWPGADPLVVAELLLLALERGHDQPAMRAALLRVGKPVLQRARGNADWCRDLSPFQTRILWCLLTWSITEEQPGGTPVWS